MGIILYILVYQLLGLLVEKEDVKEVGDMKVTWKSPQH
jgi:hypothetical protein